MGLGLVDVVVDPAHALLDAQRTPLFLGHQVVLGDALGDVLRWITWRYSSNVVVVLSLYTINFSLITAVPFTKRKQTLKEVKKRVRSLRGFYNLLWKRKKSQQQHSHFFKSCAEATHLFFRGLCFHTPLTSVRNCAKSDTREKTEVLSHRAVAPDAQTERTHAPSRARTHRL